MANSSRILKNEVSDYQDAKTTEISAFTRNELSLHTAYHDLTASRTDADQGRPPCACSQEIASQS